MGLLQNIARAARAFGGEKLYNLDECVDTFFARSTDWERWQVFDAFRAKMKGALLYSRQGDEQYIVDTADNVMSRGVYVNGVHFFDAVQEALDLIARDRKIDPKTRIFVDVGANLGITSVPVVMRGLCREAIAIEPTPSTCRLLRANVALNGLQDRIRVVEAALSNEDGEVELELSDENSGDNRLAVASEENAFNENRRAKTTVKAMKFDTLLADVKIEDCIVWMDVQGFEGIVLEGATRLTANRTPLVVEFWPYGMRRAGTYEKLKQAVSGYEKFYALSSGVRDGAKARPIGALDDYLNSMDVENKDLCADLLLL